MTPEQAARARHIEDALERASDEDKDTISRIMQDVVDAMVNDGGGGVLFVDTTGEGEMNIHLIGAQDIAPAMLRAAPQLYAQMFSVPDGAGIQ